jgi:hypothetical protein
MGRGSSLTSSTQISKILVGEIPFGNEQEADFQYGSRMSLVWAVSHRHYTYQIDRI